MIKKVLPVHPGAWPRLSIPIAEPWFGSECDVKLNRLAIKHVERIALPWFGDYRFVIHADHPDPEVTITFVYLSTFDPRPTYDGHDATFDHSGGPPRRE